MSCNVVGWRVVDLHDRMPIASVMAESTQIDPGAPRERASAREAREPGAPVSRDHIDPDLVKLGRPRAKVGVITAAGLVVLCVVFLLRLGPDRRFAGSGSEPKPATVADVVAGKVDTDQLVVVPAEPLVSHAIRATKAKGSLGFRVVPARGTADRLWIVVSGDGWDAPATAGTIGRLRRLDDLAFADAVRGYAIEHARPVFASAAAVRAGFVTGTVSTASGDTVTLADRDAIALDVIDPDTSVIAASFNERLPDTAAWSAALARAGITVTTSGAPDAALGQVRFQIAAPVATTTTKLEAAGLWAARIEPVTHHYQTTWAALRRSPPGALDAGAKPLPDAQIGLIGLYVSRAIPQDAYALVTGELPDDYWYVMPITVALVAILLVFAWALVRAIRTVRQGLVPAPAP